jgi:hypothetical protein
MKPLIKIISYPLLVVFLLLSIWELFETTYSLARGSYKQYSWFGLGIIAYILVRRLPFISKNIDWFETQTHEWLHTIVAIMFGQKIHSVSASISEGVMYHSGRFAHNIFVSLAPYCLPVYTYAFCVLRLLSAKQTLHIFDLLIGFTLAFHLIAFWKEARPYQTDIRKSGLFISYVFITAFLSFNLTTILLTIQKGIGNAIVFIMGQFWDDIQNIWNWIM